MTDDAASEERAPEVPAPRTCLDCGRPVATRFCPHCGQRQDLLPLALRGLIWELLIEILDTDARVWRTLRTLVREPGQLTLDWAAGRRMRHVPPFRLYLVLNVLAFLVFSLSSGPEVILDSENGTPADQEAELVARLEALEGETGPGVEGRRRGLERALGAVRAAGAVASGPREESTDGIEVGVDGAVDFEGDPEVAALLARFGLDEARARAALARVIEQPRAFAADVYERLPTVMILLLPVLAIVLSCLYLLAGRPYVVHLVGLAHLHAFVFLLLLIVEGFEGFAGLLTLLGVPWLPGLLAWAPTAGFAVAFWYLGVWLKRLYGHGTAGAIAMSVVLFLLHLIGAALGVMLVTLLTFIDLARIAT